MNVKFHEQLAHSVHDGCHHREQLIEPTGGLPPAVCVVSVGVLTVGPYVFLALGALSCAGVGESRLAQFCGDGGLSTSTWALVLCRSYCLLGHPRRDATCWPSQLTHLGGASGVLHASSGV